MTEIRRISAKEGDAVGTITLQEAVQEVETALEGNYLVVDETTEAEKRIIKNATGLTENSKVLILPLVTGG